MSQQGLCGMTNPFVTSKSSFGGYFWVGSDSVFLDVFWVNKGCARWGFLVSSLETVSVMISKLAATQFSLTLYESTGDVRADESIRHLWKEFRGPFMSAQRLSFPWCFLSQQVLCALRIPGVISGCNFRGYFWVGDDSVFIDSLWVNRAVRADESIRHMWKQFRGLFLTGRRLSFPWLFMSTQGLCGLTNPLVTCESSFGGYFWMRSDSVFLDCLKVNRGCVRWWIHGSPLETFSVTISERAATLFFLIVSESTGAVCAEHSMRHLWKQFRRLFWVGNDSFFLDCLWVKRGCVRWRIHGSPLEHFLWRFLRGQRLCFSWLFLSQQVLWALSITCIICGSSFEGYFEWATTQFSLIVNEWTGVVRAEDSLCHL